jgi:hypothetical protein
MKGHSSLHNFRGMQLRPHILALWPIECGTSKYTHFAAGMWNAEFSIQGVGHLRNLTLDCIDCFSSICSGQGGGAQASSPAELKPASQMYALGILGIDTTKAVLLLNKTGFCRPRYSLYAGQNVEHWLWLGSWVGGLL